MILGLYLEVREGSSSLRWAMIVLWVLFSFVAVFSFESLMVGNVLSSLLVLVVLVVNLCRGRIGLRPFTLGIPIVPVFSER